MPPELDNNAVALKIPTNSVSGTENKPFKLEMDRCNKEPIAVKGGSTSDQEHITMAVSCDKEQAHGIKLEDTSNRVQTIGATQFMIMTADGQIIPISERQLSGLVDSGDAIAPVTITGQYSR